MAEKTKSLDLGEIKDLVYSTPPMRRLLAIEKERGTHLYGEVIDLSEKSEIVKKVPIKRLKAAFKTINRETRGSPEGYHEAVLKEFESLRVFRERAEKCKV